MKIETAYNFKAKEIEWDQIPSGTIFTKFTSVDDGGPNKDFRVVLHGLADCSGRIYILQENITSDPDITGAQK